METKRIYKYKLDFYYKALIIYFIFLTVYVILRGNLSEKKFSFFIEDPIIYIITLFIIYSLIVLLIKYIRNRQIIFEEDKIILKNRFGERSILFSDVVSVRFSHERGKFIEGTKRIRIVKLKLKNRKRNLRIKIGEYYNERNLIREFKNIIKA